MESNAATLTGLSPELFQLIVDRLDFVGLVKLSMTCKKYHKTIDPRAILVQRGSLKEAMREVDTQEGREDEFACYRCTRMLPKDHFTHAQCRDKTTSRSGRRKTQRMTRICMACAVKTKYYRHLQPVKFRGTRHYHCHRCGTLAPEAKRCKEMSMPYADMPILEIRTTVCFPDLYKPGDDLAALEALPRAVIKNIAKFLTYKDGLRLGMVSQWMHTVVKPAEMVPLHERYMLTECRFAPRGSIPWCPELVHDFPRCARLPCFVCFRVRDKKHFSQRQVQMAQADQDQYWRMRCNECLYKLYVQGDQKLLALYRTYDVCAACRCLKVQGKRCTYCAEYCAVAEPEPVDQGISYSLGEFHVGSFRERRNRSYLTEATFPLKKKFLRWR